MSSVKRGRGRPALKQNLSPDAHCPLCEEVLTENEDIKWVGASGLNSLRRASAVRGDGVASKLQGDAIPMHGRCRTRYIDPKALRKLAEAGEVPEKERGPALRSSKPLFDPKLQCVLCGQPAELDKVLHRVATIETFRRSVLQTAAERADEWGREVQGRIATIFQDLVAAEAFYHEICKGRFFAGRVEVEKKKKRTGRPPNTEAFDKLCDFLMNGEECQYSFTTLIKKLKELSESEDVFGDGHLKNLLQDRFKDDIIITNKRGSVPILNLRSVADEILLKTWSEKEKNGEENARLETVKAAARIIREDIRSFVFDMENYPDLENVLQDNFVPDSLKLFLDVVITTQSATCKKSLRRKATLGQGIVAACRPKSYISPILLCHGLYLHRKIGSKEAVDLAYALGVSVSYDETLRFVQNYVKTPSDTETDAGNYVQFVYDNADVNVCTLDGHNTFHSLGGCKISTPGNFAPRRLVQRLERTATREIADTNRIKIKNYNRSFLTGLKKIIVKPLDLTTEVPPDVVKPLTLDFLWLAGFWAQVPRSPGWAGYMAACARPNGSFVVMMSSVLPVPFINLDPGNLETLYSALLFALDQCRKLGLKSCLVTFDQPLFLKSRDIVEASGGELEGVIVRLGGFHLLMSFMGSIGSIMEESGLAELWAQVYAPASVPPMMAGKAYARALRALLLTQTALGMLLLEKTKISKPEIGDLHSRVLAGACTDEAASTEIAVALYDAITAAGDQAALESRTGKLWWQLFQMVNHIRTFIRAERTGDWELHLYSIKRMLPFFHAAAHINYAKTAHLYLQDMEELHLKMDPEEYFKFTAKGFFTIRRAEGKHWSGVWTDMIIEQEIMRAIKSQGGLTRRGGMEDSVVQTWVLSVPLLIEVCRALDRSFGVAQATSEQHKDLQESSRLLHEKHLHIFHTWLREHNPFVPGDGIMSIASRVRRDGATCDRAEEIGLDLILLAVGQDFGTLSIKRSAKVITLAGKKAAKQVAPGAAPVSTSHLFLRMLSHSSHSETDLRDSFKYELASFPMALFENTGLMRKTGKSKLLDHLVVDENDPTVLPALPFHPQRIVVDGGWLLHAVPWPKKKRRKGPPTFEKLFQVYIDYLVKVKKYDVRILSIIFDGYGLHWSTKGEEQRRRGKNKFCPEIIFEATDPVTAAKEDFLSNEKNKTRFIKMLKDRFEGLGAEVLQADSDADVLIVETALRHAQQCSVSVVGNDTDLLCMLIARAPLDCKIQVVHPGTQPRLFDVAAIGRSLERKQMRDILLPLHAMSGCDTNCSMYGKTKTTVWNVVEKSEEARAALRVFNDPTATQEAVAKAGEAFVLALYKKKNTDNCLNTLRYYEFKKLCAKKKLSADINLATLPPTKGACREFSLRGHLQVQTWLHGVRSAKLPTEWGWKIGTATIVPVMTADAVAPAAIMKDTSCGCKKGCAANTSCSCRAVGKTCDEACFPCRGETCSNTIDEEIDDFCDLEYLI